MPRPYGNSRSDSTLVNAMRGPTTSVRDATFICTACSVKSLTFEKVIRMYIRETITRLKIMSIFMVAAALSDFGCAVNLLDQQ